jgi:hypothetical protein
MPLLMFNEAYISRWEEFAGDAPADDSILIFDGTLIHHQINDLIREYNANEDIIAEHLSSLLYIIQKLKPIIFYLSSSDVRKRLLQARESRNQPIPSNCKIAYWENRKRVDLYVLDRLSAVSHILDIDGGWNAVIETMVNILI